MTTIVTRESPSATGELPPASPTAVPLRPASAAGGAPAGRPPEAGGGPSHSARQIRLPPYLTVASPCGTQPPAAAVLEWARPPCPRPALPEHPCSVARAGHS